MDRTASLAALGALAQETRIDIFRTLVRAGPDGLCAGEIARGLAQRQNTISTNLAILSRAGLTTFRREGRSVRYFADMEGMRHLIAYLLEDCCGAMLGAAPDTSVAWSRAVDGPCRDV